MERNWKLCSFPRSFSQAVHKLIVDGPVMVGRHANESCFLAPDPTADFFLSTTTGSTTDGSSEFPREINREMNNEEGGVASFVGGEISSRNARAY